MKNDEFQTRDLSEAALLYLHNLKLLRLLKEDDYVWFIFANKAEATELSNRFWQKTISVDAKSYAETLRFLKDRIFAYMR